MVRICKIQQYAHNFIKRLAKALLIMYQIFLSPIIYLLSLSTIGGGCRFYPTCSEYGKQVINKYGISIKSIFMILSRLLRCQPIRFSKTKNNAGYDPVK